MFKREVKNFVVAFWVPLIFALALLWPVGVVKADSTFVDSGAVAGDWLLPGSPYIIRGDVTVSDGTSLYIEHGVRVVFTGSHKLIVLGDILAAGVPGDSVYFTTDTLANPLKWKGIRFLNCDTTAALEYCVIEFGRAQGAGDDRYGGGIECQTSRPLIRHCSVRNNYATIQGGGVYCRDNARPVLDSCTFSGNFAVSGGGGMFCRNSAPILTGCAFISNSTNLEGGGLHARNGSSPIITNCEFENNFAVTFGGGLFCTHTQSQPVVSSCRFEDNSAQNGGAIASNDAGPSLERSLFVSNSASVDGGALWLSRLHRPVMNLVLHENSATHFGGGVYLSDSSTAEFNYCTAADNIAVSGSALFVQSSTPRISSSIFTRAESCAAVHFQGSASAELAHNCFALNGGGDFSGTVPSGVAVVDTVNFNGDPCDQFRNLFLNPELVNPAGGDFHLGSQSPCISGAEGGEVENDISGAVRPAPVFTQPDIGAYESVLGSPFQYACGSLSGILGPGDVIVGCDISVEAGDSLTIVPGTTLKFAGKYSFTIRGTLHANGVDADSIRFTRFYEQQVGGWKGIRFLDSLARGNMDYCIVEHVRGENYERPSGCGGIYISRSSPRISHCLIQHNFATYRGAGIACFDGAAPQINDCWIYSNSAIDEPFRYGGGIAVAHSTPQFNRCLISNNSSTYGGGGVFADSANLVMNECIISDNVALFGGGIFSRGPGGTLNDCMIQNNTAEQGGGGGYLRSLIRLNRCWIRGNVASYGGGISCPFYAAWLDHCVIWQNSAGIGGGVMCESSEPAIFNCTIVENSAPSGAGIGIHNAAPYVNSTVVASSVGSGCLVSGNSALASISYSNSYGNSSGNYEIIGTAPDGLGLNSEININEDSCDVYQNISIDPALVNAGQGDFHLLETSPCVHAGDPERPPDPDGTITDIGAFPYFFQFSPNEPFDLLSPADNDTIRSLPAQFCWQSSFDPDAGDEVNYQLYFQTESLTTPISVGTDTCALVDLLVLGFQDSTVIAWYVKADSRFPQVSVHSISTRYFLFVLPVSADAEIRNVPQAFALESVYPNPFNARAEIRYAVPMANEVSLAVYDLLGRQISVLVHGRHEPGIYTTSFDARSLTSGLYFCKLSANGFVATQKLVVLK